MIDFRYHVVSLVAVFIALAVGIVLGAGPLREGISDSLEGEVSQLRVERTELRAQLDSAQGRAQGKDDALGMVSERVAAGTLTGSRVGLVIAPGADRNLVAQVEDGIDGAGGHVALTADLDASLERGIRPAAAVELAVELADDLQVPQPSEGEDPELPAVLAAALMGADRPGSAGAWLAAVDRLEADGYLDLTWHERSTESVLDRRPPDALVLIVGGLSVETDGALDPEAQEVLDVRVGLVDALARLDAVLVVLGEGSESTAQRPDGGQAPLVQAVRSDRELRREVSTVDNLESAAGRLSAVLAIGWELDDESGHYGQGPEADAPAPVPPPVRFSTRPAPGDEAEVTAPVPDEDISGQAPTDAVVDPTS